MFTVTRKKQLASRIRARREELGIRQDGIQDHGGPSPETVNQYEQGNIPDTPQNRTLHGYDKALRWQTGSIRRFLETGEDPIPLEAPEKILATISPAESGHGEHAPPGTVTLPKPVLDDLIRAVSKLILVARATGVEDGPLRRGIEEVQRRSSDLSAMMIGMESRDPEVLSLIDRITAR
jgi:hypothetical protein